MSDECVNCNEYDTQKHYCPQYCDVIKHTLDDRYQQGREDAIKDADHWLYEAEMNNLNNKDFCLGLARAREIIWTCKTADKEQKNE